MNAGKIITGLAVGFAAGAILGVMFAPGKGNKTRKKFAKKSIKLNPI